MRPNCMFSGMSQVAMEPTLDEAIQSEQPQNPTQALANRAGAVGINNGESYSRGSKAALPREVAKKVAGDTRTAARVQEASGGPEETTIMTLRTLFEKQVFIRLTDDQTAFISTTKRPLLSRIRRFRVSEAGRDFAPQVTEHGAALNTLRRRS